MTKAEFVERGILNLTNNLFDKVFEKNISDEMKKEEALEEILKLSGNVVPYFQLLAEYMEANGHQFSPPENAAWTGK